MSDVLALPPLPPPLPRRLAPLRGLRALLAWGFGVSLGLHAILGPLAGLYRPPIADATEVSMVTLSRRVTVTIPTPAPTIRPTPAPTEPPTPPPHRTPPPGPTPPIVRRAAPLQTRLKINVYKTTSQSRADGPVEPKYRALPGSESGVPQGTVASAPPAPPSLTAPATGKSASGSEAGATLAPAQPPSPERPKCAVQNAAATATTIAEPEYPESARQGGITGEAVVTVSLSAAGILTAATIGRSSGNTALDFAAIRAARASSYAPEIVACQPVAGTYSFYADFTRNNSETQ